VIGAEVIGGKPMARVTPLELRAVGKRFGRLAVLRHVDLRVDAGEIVGLMGANGSGKTTLLSIAMGLLAASDGEIVLGGTATTDVTLEQRQHMALVTHTTQLYAQLTARENMDLWVELRRAAGGDADDPVALVERLGLGHAIDRSVGTFSRGMMQRLSLARALVGRPELLLLDEPFTALDRAGVERLSEVLLEERDRGLAVLLSSHDHEAMLAVTDRVVLLEDGRLVGEARRRDGGDADGEGYRQRMLALGGVAAGARRPTLEAARARA
jgi:ABC-type multidrug transport system ATPase subunit